LWVIERGGESLNEFSAWSTACGEELVVRYTILDEGDTTTSAVMTLPDDRCTDLPSSLDKSTCSLRMISTPCFLRVPITFSRK
jgi:hypothetical protein